MKRNQKSALMKGAIAVLVLCGLNACDSINNVQWPHVYGPNEVPPSVMNEPRAVVSAPAPPPQSPYPRLGDVPMAPKDFTPQHAIDQTKDEMVNDRVEANTLKQQADNPPPVLTPTQQQ